MNTLVTGALGFIGSHYCTEPVFWYDARITNKVDCVLGEEIDIEDIHQPINKLIHLGAFASLSNYFDEGIYEYNIVFTNDIFHEFDDVRILYASSAAVHHPNNDYAKSKLYAEWLADKMQLNATGFRFYNVYGERDNGIVGKILKALKTDSPLTIYGGDQIRDFISVEDVVRILKTDTKEKIVEVGTGVGTSIWQLIDICEGVAGKKLKGLHQPRKEFEQFESVCKEPISQFTKLETGIKELYNKI